MTNKTSFFVAVAATLATMFLVSALDAKTVALWPLEYDSAIGTYDGRCLIDPANDLTVANATGAVAVVASGLGWNYPANPDSTYAMLFDPKNTCSPFTCNTSSNKGFLRNLEVGRYVYVTNDFTIEGWIRLYGLPASGSLFFIARHGLGNTAGRWLFTLRNNGGGHTGITWQINCNSQGTSGSGEQLLHRVQRSEPGLEKSRLGHRDGLPKKA